jgi:hypothetical protein
MDNTILKAVKDLLDTEFSGGAKFTELIPDLMAKGFTNSDIMYLYSVSEYTLKEFGIGKTEYIWNLFDRVKIFFYTIYEE